jgi:hypothetical protein
MDEIRTRQAYVLAILAAPLAVILLITGMQASHSPDLARYPAAREIGGVKEISKWP